MHEHMKVGLVLSGGGAKGAYQVGVIKALQELGARVDIISGASIGALNGAVLACAPSPEVGLERLTRLWQTLAETSPVTMKQPSYLTFLLAAGLKMNSVLPLTALAKAIRMLKQKTDLPIPPWLEGLDAGVLCDGPLTALMDEYFDADALDKGLPLYVSVYKSDGALEDLLSTLAAEIGLRDNPESEFLHIQSLAKNEQKNALLASAAIPLMFAPRKINDSIYSDGGQGGWQKMQGNTPIKPLLDAGCNLVIVTHLFDGSLWSRHDFPNATVLEIRPQSTISRDQGTFGGAKDLLGFDPQKIPSWIEQGYQDTLHCVGRVMKSIDARAQLTRSEKILTESESRNLTVDQSLADAMAKLV